MVAADIASGVDASTGEVEGVAVEANVTVSFHAAKIGHWVAPGKWHTGELRVAEIGIPDGAPAEPPAGLITSRVLELAPRRGHESTKFSSGQVLVVGGSRGLTGAVCMAAGAAIRAGAGYATVAVPAELEDIFEIKLTEVMSRGLRGDRRRPRARRRRRHPRGGEGRRRGRPRPRAWGAATRRWRWRASSRPVSRRRC